MTVAQFSVSSADGSVTPPRADRIGVSAALATPFAAGGTIDPQRTARHAARVVAGGASSVTLFGTTGEGASLGMHERVALLEAVLAELDPTQVVMCVCATSIEQAVEQASDALGRGVRRLLVTPPFYFKGVEDAALFPWFAQFAKAIEAREPELILYHIPQVTGVLLTAHLIRLLKNAFGPVILGVKDSSGDWDTARTFLANDDLEVVIGDERLLARAVRLGAAGTISGMANLYPARLGEVIRTGQTDAEIDALVDEIVRAPVTPVVKALVGASTGEEGWDRVRPPLSQADEALVRGLRQRMATMTL